MNDYKGRRALVVLSGGMDSTTLLYLAAQECAAVRAVGFSYDQRHGRELRFAAETCDRLGVPFEVVPLTIPGAPSALQHDDVDVPTGHYAADTMKATVVSNRNMILIAMAVAVAQRHGCDVVLYGAHAGDHDIYPDCRAEFVEALARAVELCDWNPPSLIAPFVRSTKAGIASVGADLGVPFESTWSCYAGGDLHCGNCGTCVERREAFELAGVPDPTTYNPDALPLAELLTRR